MQSWRSNNHPRKIIARISLRSCRSQDIFHVLLNRNQMLACLVNLCFETGASICLEDTKLRKNCRQSFYCVETIRPLLSVIEASVSESDSLRDSARDARRSFAFVKVDSSRAALLSRVIPKTSLIREEDVAPACIRCSATSPWKREMKLLRSSPRHFRQFVT